MAQESVSLRREDSAQLVTVRAQGMGLRWKIAGALAGVIVLFGIFVVGIVNELMGRALRGQIDQRALAIATNLSDAVAGHVVRRNVLELYAHLTKYGLLEGVAYAFIKDGKGEILAHSLGTFPSELREPVSTDRLRQAQKRVVSLRGETVYETSVPILGGQVGVVHVGLKGDLVEKEIRRALLPVLGLIGVVLLAGVVLAVLLARNIVRPMLGLKEVADKISKGDLETPVAISSRDEIGEVARSLERMRVSLKAAMVRLSRS